MDITVCVPDSVLSERPSLLSKTEKVGEIIRAISIFGVKTLKVYHDREDGSLDDMKLFEILVKYLLTPPYLRKFIFPMNNKLKYVGLLPPINIPSNAVEKEDNLRFGMVIRNKNEMYVETGIGKRIRLTGYSNAKNGEIVPVKLVKNGSEVAAVRHNFEGYSGPNIISIIDLYSFIDSINYDDSAVIFTSREGALLSRTWKDLAHKIKKTGNVFLLFGSPKRGFEDMLDQSYRKKGFWVNIAEGQAVKTIRTEEAVLISLGLINLIARITEF
ncbi:MAG: putative RNA uridine N3 methyltransferase [Conexivisphaerales archaeon]